MGDKESFLVLLDHPEPATRERAVIHLGEYLDADVAGRLVEVAEDDPSPTVRLAALGVLRFS